MKASPPNQHRSPNMFHHNNGEDNNISQLNIGGMSPTKRQFFDFNESKFDEDGNYATSGKVDDLILNQAIDNFEIKSFDKSLDVKDFDLSFVKGLSFEDGCATLTKFTAYLISDGLKKIDKKNKIISNDYILCGGGRKNNFLIKSILEFLDNKSINLTNIDNYNFDGNFIESQAFAFLAIRSYLDLPISFPNTTRCKKAVSGGEVFQNF